MHKENTFNIQAEEYEAWFRKNDQLFASELAALRPLIPDVGEGIDIGTGTGLFAAEFGIKTGLEPSKDMGKLAIQKGIQLIRAAAEGIPVADGIYDYALMVTADCFLKDVPASFREIRRILRSDGRFIIAFLDRESPLGKIYEEKKKEHASYRNANFHSALEISDLLELSGFAITDCWQTVFSLENIFQEPRTGNGDGVFAVIRARRKG